MVQTPPIQPGTRVRLRSASHVLKLQSNTGRIVGPDERWSGYYVVRLDEPAIYDNGVTRQPLLEVREEPSNMEVIAERRQLPAAPARPIPLPAHRPRAQGVYQIAAHRRAGRDAAAAKSTSRSTTNATKGKRERIDTTPGKPGGSRYVRRDSKGQFTADQVSLGKSLAADRRQKAATKAPKGMKDRGD